MKDKKTFGERLKELRKARNLSQRELAERVSRRLKADDRRGFDFTYLSKIENDKMPPPSIPSIIHLAEELDADSDELLALAGKIPPDIGESIKYHKSAFMFFRSAGGMNLSNDDWDDLLKDLKRRKR